MGITVGHDANVGSLLAAAYAGAVGRARMQQQEVNLRAQGLAQQAQQHSDEMGLRYYQAGLGAQEADANRQQGVMNQDAEAYNRQSAAVQGAQLEAQLNQTKLTQSEQMLMQRRQNQLADVRNNSSLSDQEKQDLILHIQTGISPLQDRMTREQILASQLGQQVHQQQLTQMQGDRALLARTLDERTTTLYTPAQQLRAARAVDAQYGDDLRMDPDTRHSIIQQHLAENEAGIHFTETRPGHFERVDDTREQQQQARQDQLFSHAYDTESRALESRLQHAMKPETDPNHPDRELANPDTFNRRLSEAVQRRMQVMSALRNGQPLPQQADQPFSRNGQMTPSQRQQIGAMDQLSFILLNPQTPLAEGRRNELKAKLNEAAQMLMRFGSPGAMPANDRSRYNRILDEIGTVRAPAAGAPAAPVNQGPPQPQMTPRPESNFYVPMSN